MDKSDYHYFNLLCDIGMQWIALMSDRSPELFDIEAQLAEISSTAYWLANNEAVSFRLGFVSRNNHKKSKNKAMPDRTRILGTRKLKVRSVSTPFNKEKNRPEQDETGTHDNSITCCFWTLCSCYLTSLTETREASLPNCAQL